MAKTNSDKYFFVGSGSMPVKGEGLVYGDEIPAGALQADALVELINRGLVSTTRPDLTSGSAADRIPIHVIQGKLALLEKENVRLADENDKLKERLTVESTKLRGQLQARDIRIQELEVALESAGQDITAGLESGAGAGAGLSEDGAGPEGSGAGPKNAGKGGK